MLHTKRAFLHRGHRTPLGIVEDYWDRTEVDGDIFFTILGEELAALNYFDTIDTMTVSTSGVRKLQL